MNNFTQEQQVKNQIREKIYIKYGFYLHAIVYVLVNMLLIFLNLKFQSQKGGYWFVYPLLGWGIGLSFHFLKFYATTSNFLDKKIEKEYLKQKNKIEK